jgi:putative glycosyltransferase
MSISRQSVDTPGQAATPCELSIVSTLYKSQPYLQNFISACIEAMASIGVTSYEFVFVDDGSPDKSVRRLRELRSFTPHIRIVELTRNFGHHQAAIAGLQHARGDRIFLADCDMEVDPRVLSSFWTKLEACGADVVFGYQEGRKGGAVERVGGNAFWRLFNALSDTRVAENMVTERLMSRRYVNALLTLGDRNIFLAGMMAWAGFTQVGMPIEKSQRRGSSTYTLIKRLGLAAKAVTAFSAKPLYASLWIGAMALVSAVVHGAIIVSRKLLHPEAALAGYPSIVALLTGAFGIQMMSLGIVGIYVARIFVQTQGRPAFIVKNVD